MEQYIRGPELRCLFCKQSSEHSTSVEHIVPYSLGNRRAVLPKGIVCDQCNNYFARKIEQPLLADRFFRNLRAWYQVPNKRGRSPSLHGFLAGTELEVSLRLRHQAFEFQVERDGQTEEIYRRFVEYEKSAKPTAFIFDRPIEPPSILMSRLLAKIALETLALRLLHDRSTLQKIVDLDHWDTIRRWARVGDNFDLWPYSFRRVFPEETLMRDPESNEWVQAGYSLDLFITTRRETYMAFIIYGHEFVMNTGGPSVKGYEEWLRQQSDISPLVERLGLRLHVDEQSNPPKTYLLGNPTVNAGIEFDVRQGIAGLGRRG